MGINLTRTIEWKAGSVTTIDQTKLPNRTSLLKIESCDGIAKAIRTMQVRGAPLLGAVAAYGLALTAFHSKAKDKDQIMRELAASAEILKRTRPTAVNLFWALKRVMKKAEETRGDAVDVVKAVVDESQMIATEDVEANQKIGKHGTNIVDDGDNLLTHCNAGSLATVGYGTALGVIRAAWSDGKSIKVIATETRPLLQGARLTTYELLRERIPVTLITDNMVGYIMSKGLVDKVIVGADRIVKDAVVNKIGTYTIAVLAKEHKVPFYVAAPKSTFDMNRLAEDVIVEERNIEEVVKFGDMRIAPKKISALNPAFDITPMKYITAIIYEEDVISPEEFQKLSAING
ncbi:MAG: S-methyl-5-thioribose-1-phosphate isomerase [Candidatus Bathyarchaeota archaeon]|nr:MAG: S-methyl-5-thioribose-1-phosphate isomerase [Candidatus Bathyarchaeota archaeon]